MKTIFSLIFISIFLSSNIFAQDPSLSFEGNKIYINNCQWGYFPVMGSIYANHIKMNNASNLDYEIYNKYTSIFSFDKGKKEITDSLTGFINIMVKNDIGVWFETDISKKDIFLF